MSLTWLKHMLGKGLKSNKVGYFSYPSHLKMETEQISEFQTF
jgi:hypothetical protein